MHDDNPSEAIKALYQVEAIQGVNEDLSLQKQKIYLLTRKNDKAEAEIQKLSNAFPGETRYMAMLAERYAEREARQSLGDVHQETRKPTPPTLMSGCRWPTITARREIKTSLLMS